MTRLFPAQRRAERFDSLVEGGRSDSVDRATTELLELVGALRAVPDAQPRAEFVADLRERLMVAAESELVTAPARERDDVARLTIKPRRTRRERRVGIALGAVAIIGATTSMAVASQSAIPGDALYPLKRAIENTQAGFSVGDDAKGETVMSNASERLDEVGKLSHESKPDARLVIDTLNTFTQQFTDASGSLLNNYETNGNQSSIEQIHQNAANSITELASLDGVIPAAAHDALLNAAQTVFSIDLSAANLCPDPECGEALLEMPSTLVAGGTGAVDGLTGPQAGGALPGAGGPSSDAQQGTGDGGKGNHNPSGLNPPETPIDIPSATNDATGALDDILPSSDPSNGGGGNGGKHKPKPVDLGPVTDTVNDVVNGVVDGVNQVLGGLTGNGG